MFIPLLIVLLILCVITAYFRLTDNIPQKHLLIFRVDPSTVLANYINMFETMGNNLLQEIDEENVHDHALNKDIKIIMNRIKSEQPIMKKSLHEVQSEILALTPDDKFNDVMLVLGHINTEFVSQLDMTDAEVLVRIWERAEGQPNEKLIKESVIDNLCNCIDDLGVVCVTGRTHRIISSLILLDKDPENWKMQLAETYNEEILNKSKNIINDVANIAVEEMNADYEYDSSRVVENKKEIKQLLLKNSPQKTMEILINKMIDSYAELFTPAHLDKIKKDNFAAII